MALTDLQATVIEIINEVQRKLGLDSTSSITANSQSRVLLDHLNDVVAELADLGDWQELLVSANTTLVSGQQNYSINTSEPVKRLVDIYYGDERMPVNYISREDMRQRERANIFGRPIQFAIYGVDSAANPNIRLYPKPNSATSYISTLFYSKPRLYTTSDANTTVPFPAKVVVQGLLAKAILDEEGGTPTDHYTKEYISYQQMAKDAISRYNMDTGNDVRMTPASRRFRK